MYVETLDTRKLHVGRIEGVNPSLLRSSSRLGRLPNAMLERVARGSECQLIPAGNTIYSQDDGADAVFLLLDGAVSLERRETDGGVVKYRVLGPDGTFGDVALLGRPERYFNASTDVASVVIRTPLTLLRDVLAANPELAQAWIHAVSTDLERRGRDLAVTVPIAITTPAFTDAA